VDRRVVELSSTERRCFPLDIRPWTAGLSVCRRLDAAVSRAIWSPAAGSPLPVDKLSASERRCHPLDVRPWTAGLSDCPRRDAVVSRCHLVTPSAALRQLLFNFCYLSFP